MLSHEMRVEQSLHLLRVHVVLSHVLAELVCVALKQDHRPVVHLRVQIVVHDRRARVAVIDVLVHNALLRRHLSERVSVLKTHVAESREACSAIAALFAASC